MAEAIVHSQRELDYAFVRDTAIEDMQRVAFIRLVPAGTTIPATSRTAEEAHVDFDAEGNIIGVTLFLDD